MSLLSIIIPVFNSEKTITRTLESLNIMSQESKELTEVVIIDDGSQDRSLEIMESIKLKLSDLNFVIIKQENQGSSVARNAGLERCSGDWIFLLDSDDEMVFDPVPHIQKSPDCSALGFTVQWFKNLKPGRRIRPVHITPDNHFDVLTSANPFQPSNFIIKKNRIECEFEKSYIYLEDWPFWIKNPLIFENIMINRKMISAHIHAHGENKSSNYATVGIYRKKFANDMLEYFGGRLTRKQTNNLLIQAQIGQILQGKTIRFNNFVRFPCDMKLYGKLIIYAVLRRRFPKFDVYGS